MKRHPALVSLSHDHHRALVEARRLRRGEFGGFAEFFAFDLVRHFRQEEETVFPLLAEVGAESSELSQALMTHQRIRAQARRPDASLGELIEAHIRFEERVLFATIERVVPEERLAELLPSQSGGPVWGISTDDLNATLLAWPPGTGTAEHVNQDRDVILVILDGAATIEIEDEARSAREGDVVVLAKGLRRAITAGPAGVRYLTVHRRRAGLQIGPSNPAQ